ncbi:MAG: ABC transporter permease [Candidatus Micrarchaeota archaeon]|nr:ABC transporter permease [Candidatus Micrarchaeota archaeon]
MNLIYATYAIWLREVKVFFREKERVVSAIVTPLLWILIFGAGLGSSVKINGIDYQRFIFPGIVGMAVLFGSIFYGLYVIWDRKLDFLKEVLVAPVPRSAVFIGKMLGGASDVLLQIAILLAIGVALGMTTTMSAILSFAVCILLSFCIVSLGLIIGANMKSPEGFNLIMSFVLWPMFMLSGALFPVENLPAYLAVLIPLNPLSYGVDLLRYVMLGGRTAFGVATDLMSLGLFSIVFAAAGIYSFEKMKM